MVTTLLAFLLIATGLLIVATGAWKIFLRVQAAAKDAYAPAIRIAAGLGLIGMGQVLRLLLEINGKL